MNTRLVSTALSATLVLLLIAYTQADKPVQPQTPFEQAQPAMDSFQSWDAEVGQSPLLLAGNTACNPRVTVCEE